MYCAAKITSLQKQIFPPDVFEILRGRGLISHCMKAVSKLNSHDADLDDKIQYIWISQVFKLKTPRNLFIENATPSSI